ncbi:MAG: tetratricopeptide repeat protein [Planctomycetes bacterium]|nr:tetratricopeptide repeat protein [Planctomycetota bacterium]MBI3834898.1 tetratricopeptide repeat protein [Planctomycetota bacterium]
MFRRSNAFSIAFWTITALVAGCASHDNAPFAGRSAPKNAPRSFGNYPGLPDKMPDILPQTHFAAGELFESQGEYDKAIEQYKKAIAVNHNFASAYHRLGLALGSTGRHEEAIDAIGKAAQLKPQNAVFHNNLAYEHMNLNRWDDAERELRCAIESQPGLHRAHINLALALSRSNRFDEALAEFKVVLPETDAYYNLGLLYRGQKQYAQAAEAFRHVLALDADFTAAKTQLDQVSGLIESRIAEQRKNVVSVQETPSIAVEAEQKGSDDLQVPIVAEPELPKTEAVTNSRAPDDVLAAADELDQEASGEDTQPDTTNSTNHDGILSHEVWHSFIRLAQIVDNEANCTRIIDEVGEASPVEVKAGNLVFARVAEEQNERSGPSILGPAPEPTMPCVELLASEGAEEDIQWVISGLATDELAASSRQNVEIQMIPFQSTDCAPLDVFAGMQILGISAREDLPTLCADYSPLVVQAFAERFELGQFITNATVQSDLATRKEHWFQDFRDLEGLLAISENDAFCLDVITTDEVHGIVESPSPRSNSEFVAAGAIQLNGTANPNPAAVREKDSDDMESSSIARAFGPIAPPADRN